MQPPAFSAAPQPVSGWCDPLFEPVREAFAGNFAARGELGAAVCVVVDGRVVVDLWGGWADAALTRPWEPDTLVNVFSVGKGLTSAVMARLVGLGLLSPEDRVERWWPELGPVTVAQVLSHQAGHAAVRERLPDGSMLDPALMARVLASQQPWWEPGTAHGYHVNTFGFLVGELVRRVTGDTLGRVLARDIAGPLGADVHVGLAARSHGRVAEFVWPGGDHAAPAAPADLSGLELMRYNAYFNPGDASGLGVVNTVAWREAEIPSTNGHASARGVARVYAALAAGGSLAGVRVVDPVALGEAVQERVYGPDLVLERPSRFGLGFQLTQPERPLGPGPAGFGHFGAGGSLGFCDPDAGVALGYVMNTMGVRWQNPRNRALIDALYTCLT